MLVGVDAIEQLQHRAQLLPLLRDRANAEGGSFPLAGLALAVVGQTIFMIGSYACYARKDTRSPLSAMAM